MNVLRLMNCIGWGIGILCILFIAAEPAMSKDDAPYTPADNVFDKCEGLKSKELTDCCDERHKICYSECWMRFPPKWGRYAPWIICEWDCDAGISSCKANKKIKKRIAWPGEDRSPIPGIFFDDTRIVTGDDIGLSISTATSVFEIRRDGVELGESACVAINVSCSSPREPEYDVVGKECRPFLASGAVECRICSTGEKSEACKPYAGCRPVVLSAQPCAGAELGRNKAAETTQ